jgi:putative oxidoreductase
MGMMNQATALERFAYGHPSEDSLIHVAPRAMTALIGRLLMSVIFLLSGMMKLMNLDQTVGYMASKGIPSARELAVVAGIAEVCGAVSLMFGFLARIGALGLFLYLIPTTWIFHSFWTYEGAEQQMQMVNFLKNIALMGGLLTLVAYGAGRLSLDAKLREPKQP